MANILVRINTNKWGIKTTSKYFNVTVDNIIYRIKKDSSMTYYGAYQTYVRMGNKWVFLKDNSISEELCNKLLAAIKEQA